MPAEGRTIRAPRLSGADGRRRAGGLRAADGEEFGDGSREWRRLFAEFWGALLLVSVAAGGDMAVALSGGKVSFGMAEAAPGLMVMAAIYFMGSVSGAHLNPSVSLAFALRSNFPWSRVPGYVGAQVAGALAAVLLLRALLGTAGHLGATIPDPRIGALRACAIEVLLTAGLVNTVLGTAAGARNVGPNAALAVGGYIVVAGMWAGPFSGASMNPARSLGPDIVRGVFADSWVYVLGPVIGAVIAVVCERVLRGPPTPQGSRAAQGDAATGPTS